MPMSMPEIEQTLKALRLPGMRATLETRALQISHGDLSFLDAFSLLLTDEMDRRRGKLVERRYALSGMVEKKTLSEFDWSFNPKIPKRACFELVTLKFIANREDALFIGPPGTGKSHIAKTIAYAGVLAGHRVFYRDAKKLIEDIMKSKALGTIRKLNIQITQADLVIIDDLFLRKLPHDACDDIMEIIMNRYEKGSTLITSNRPLEDWSKLLGDVVTTTPIIDRLLHHGHLLKFDGKSYRLKESAERIAKSARTS